MPPPQHSAQAATVLLQSSNIVLSFENRPPRNLINLMNESYNRISMPTQKRIALIAHDEQKDNLMDWAVFNSEYLTKHVLFATGTTGRKLSEALDFPVYSFLSGPMGGDQQIGAHIAESKLDALIFFTDPLSSHPHDVDIKALLRIAVLWNIPIACNRSTADFILTSDLMQGEYSRMIEKKLIPAS